MSCHGHTAVLLYSKEVYFSSCVHVTKDMTNDQIRPCARSDWSGSVCRPSPHASSPSCVPQQDPFPAAQGGQLHPHQQHATSTSWCMGSSSSVDAMLTCPRPLLCCCSCFRPSGTAPVQVCGLGLHLPSPLYTPSINLCMLVQCHALGGARAYMHVILHAWGCLVSRRRR